MRSGRLTQPAPVGARQRRTATPRRVLEQRLELRRAMRVGVLARARARSAASPMRRARGRRRAARACVGHLGAVARHQHLAPGSRNSSMPSHASVIRQAPAPAASKTRVAGEKP